MRFHTDFPEFRTLSPYDQDLCDYLDLNNSYCLNVSDNAVVDGYNVDGDYLKIGMLISMSDTQEKCILVNGGQTEGYVLAWHEDPIGNGNPAVIFGIRGSTSYVARFEVDLRTDVSNIKPKTIELVYSRINGVRLWVDGEEIIAAETSDSSLNNGIGGSGGLATTLTVCGSQNYNILMTVLSQDSSSIVGNVWGLSPSVLDILHGSLGYFYLERTPGVPVLELPLIGNLTNRVDGLTTSRTVPNSKFETFSLRVPWTIVDKDFFDIDGTIDIAATRGMANENKFRLWNPSTSDLDCSDFEITTSGVAAISGYEGISGEVIADFSSHIISAGNYADIVTTIDASDFGINQSATITVNDTSLSDTVTYSVDVGSQLPFMQDPTYTVQLVDKSSADRRRQHRWQNATGSDIPVSIAWPDLSEDFMVSGIVHVESSDGLVGDVYVSSTTTETYCNITVPAGGYIFVAGQRPVIYGTTSATLTEVNLGTSGDPEGSSLHPYSSFLTSIATSTMSGADPIPAIDYSALPQTHPDGAWTRKILGYAQWILETGQDGTSGGHTSSETGGTWDAERGWGSGFGWADVLSTVDNLNVAGNPFYKQITSRVKAMLFWEMSRILDSGLPFYWESDYTGRLGLAAANMIPYRAIESLWNTLSVPERFILRSALQVMGHANMIMPLETAANQSFHFIANSAAFIRAWKFIQQTDDDRNLYDNLLEEQLSVMTTRTGYVLGSEGNGRAFSDTYGFDRSYSGIQSAMLRYAYQAVEDDSELTSYRQDLLTAFNDLEIFFEPMMGEDSEGNILCSNGSSSRESGTRPQYGTKADMLGDSSYVARYATLDDTFPAVVAEEPPFGKIFIYQQLALLDQSPITPLAARDLPSTMTTNDVVDNGTTVYVTTPTYFAGFTRTCITGVPNIFVNGSSVGIDVGESGEIGGPFSASVENDGTDYRTEFSESSGAVLSGQGALETLSVNGQTVIQTRNISPLTVHGVYGSDGTRYYTTDPHSQNSTWNLSSKIATTTFKLYGIDGTFTRTLDFSDDSFVSVTLTTPSDPGGGITLGEVIPLVDSPNTIITTPSDFTFSNSTQFGITQSDGGSLGRMSREVEWSTSITYNIGQIAAPLLTSTYPEDDATRIPLPIQSTVNDTELDLNIDYVLEFNETITFGDSGRIYIVDDAQTITFADANSDALGISGSTLTWTNPSNMQPNTDYSVLVDPGFVKSEATNLNWSGITAASDFSFRTYTSDGGIVENMTKEPMWLISMFSGNHGVGNTYGHANWWNVDGTRDPEDYERKDSETGYYLFAATAGDAARNLKERIKGGYDLGARMFFLNRPHGTNGASHVSANSWDTIESEKQTLMASTLKSIAEGEFGERVKIIPFIGSGMVTSGIAGWEGPQDGGDGFLLGDASTTPRKEFSDNIFNGWFISSGCAGLGIDHSSPENEREHFLGLAEDLYEEYGTVLFGEALPQDDNPTNVPYNRQADEEALAGMGWIGTHSYFSNNDYTTRPHFNLPFNSIDTRIYVWYEGTSIAEYENLYNYYKDLNRLTITNDTRLFELAYNDYVATLVNTNDDNHRTRIVIEIPSFINQNDVGVAIERYEI